MNELINPLNLLLSRSYFCVYSLYRWDGPWRGWGGWRGQCRWGGVQIQAEDQGLQDDHLLGVVSGPAAEGGAIYPRPQSGWNS